MKEIKVDSTVLYTDLSRWSWWLLNMAFSKLNVELLAVDDVEKADGEEGERSGGEIMDILGGAS